MEEYLEELGAAEERRAAALKDIMRRIFNQFDNRCLPPLLLYIFSVYPPDCWMLLMFQFRQVACSGAVSQRG